jgi:hypothetical protein
VLYKQTPNIIGKKPDIPIMLKQEIEYYKVKRDSLWYAYDDNRKEKPAGKRNYFHHFLQTKYKDSKSVFLLPCEENILRWQRVLHSPNVWKSSVILSFVQSRVTNLPQSLRPGNLSETLFVIHLDTEFLLSIRFTLRQFHLP